MADTATTARPPKPEPDWELVPPGSPPPEVPLAKRLGHRAEPLQERVRVRFDLDRLQPS
jgi:hypothetical protein